jgi:hypothetical protein
VSDPEASAVLPREARAPVLGARERRGLVAQQQPLRAQRRDVGPGRQLLRGAVGAHEPVGRRQRDDVAGRRRGLGRAADLQARGRRAGPRHGGVAAAGAVAAGAALQGGRGAGGCPVEGLVGRVDEAGEKGFVGRRVEEDVGDAMVVLSGLVVAIKFAWVLTVGMNVEPIKVPIPGSLSHLQRRTQTASSSGPLSESYF